MTVFAQWLARRHQLVDTQASSTVHTFAHPPHGNWRIRSSLALLVAACMLPGILLSGYFIFAGYAQHKAKATQDLIGTARALASSLDRELAGIESGLRVLASSSALDSDDLAAFYMQAHSALPYQNITNYVLIDAQGRQVLNTLRPWGAPLPAQGNPPALQRIFADGQPVLTDVFIGPVARQHFVALGVPVRRNGRVIYSLNAGVQAGHMSDLLTSQHLPAAWIGAVIDSTGHIVSRTHDPQKYVGQLVVSDLVRGLQEKDVGIIETKTLEGIPVITAFSRSRVSGWSAAVGIPRTELTANIKRDMLVLLGASALVFALAWWFAWRMALHRVVLPADYLLARMKRMSHGEDPGTSDSPHASREFIALEQGFIDMSAQLRLREHEREAKVAAEAANRAKTHFLSRMSHELRTPLNAVLGFAQVLQMDTQERLSQRQRDMVDQIIQSGQHLLEMISDVLDVSRIESGSLQVRLTDVDVHDMMSQCHQMVSTMAQASQLRLFVSLPDSPVMVLADQTRLKQILLNLLSNAIKYNRPQGEVHLSAQVSGKHVRFAVKDTGLGMTHEQIAHLYEPFNRLGRENTATLGTGIGLVICQRLLELMQSTLFVESQAQQGSTFWFELPVAEASR